MGLSDRVLVLTFFFPLKSFLKKKKEKWNPLRVMCVLPQTPPIILVIKEWRGGWLLKFPFYFQAPFKVVFKRVSSEMLIVGKTCIQPGHFCQE